ncbi:hypothetical protein GEMRC1_005633 [Eukaryota sp. GEM-RC1]
MPSTDSISDKLINHEDEDSSSTDNVSKNKLGTLSGVFSPTILSMFCVVLFLRLGWVLAQAGLVQALLITFSAGFITFNTLLSISSICTNGTMKGGGAYYLISRALGPEFGGAIGVVFWLANAFAGVLYTLGFTDTLLHNYPHLNFIHSGDAEYDLFWTKFIISSGVVFILTILCLIGADIFSKTVSIIFFAVVIALGFIIVSIIIEPSGSSPGFTSFNWETFKANLASGYTVNPEDPHGRLYTFGQVFVINFPSVTGIMAGVNMSGDLKNPAKSITRGAFGAFSFAMVTYVVLNVLLAFTTTRQVRLDNYFILQQVCISPLVVNIAAYAVLIGSALSSIVGASRVLQALARDDLVPGLSPFKFGSRKGDEPRIATLLTWVIIQVAFFFGSVDSIASIDSMFFLLSYAVVCLACFLLRIAGAPNFRPSFKYFHWSAGLFGVVACTIIMFISSPAYAALSYLFLLIIFFYVHFKAPVRLFTECNGDVSQALLYHTVRKYLLKMGDKVEHVKYWRPQILAVFREPDASACVNAIHFVNNLKKVDFSLLHLYSKVLQINVSRHQSLQGRTTLTR